MTTREEFEKWLKTPAYMQPFGKGEQGGVTTESYICGFSAYIGAKWAWQACDVLNKAKITELEDKVVELNKPILEHLGGMQILIAQRDSAIRQLQKDSARLELENKTLREALKDCAYDFEEASQYKGEYLAKKHRDAEVIADYRKLLETTKDKP